MIFKMKSKFVEELKKYVDVDFLLYFSVEELVEKIKDYDGFIVFLLNRVLWEVIEWVERFKVISCYLVGYDYVDVEVVIKKGIYVIKVLGVLSEVVVEFVVGLMIVFFRKFVYIDKFIRRGEWDSYVKIWSIFKDIEIVYGKKVGIFGMGVIGKVIVRRMKVMGMEIFYWLCLRKEDIEVEVGVKYFLFDEVLRESDIVILVFFVILEIYYIINEERIKFFEGKYFVNIGRGIFVDEKVVVKVIEEGRLKGYVMDVFEKEFVIEYLFFKYEWEIVLILYYVGFLKEVMEDMGF